MAIVLGAGYIDRLGVKGYVEGFKHESTGDFPGWRVSGGAGSRGGGAYFSIPESRHFVASSVLSGRKFPPVVNSENMEVPITISRYPIEI